MKNYPPFLDEVHEHCPRAALLYTKLWRERNDKNTVIYHKESVLEFTSWRTFRHELMLLKNEKVLKAHFSQNLQTVTIYLAEAISKNNEKVA
jgi:hypothetical protein